MKTMIENDVIRFYPNGKPVWLNDPLRQMELMRVKKMRLIAFGGFFVMGFAFWAVVLIWLLFKIS